MQPHAKPGFEYPVQLADELKRLKQHRNHRGTPKRTDENVLVAPWNLTNFGAQQREPVHFKLMADIIKPFDVVAVQEIADNLAHVKALMTELGSGWEIIFSDPAGNDERLAYIYRRRRASPTGLAAELAMRGYERQRVIIQGIDPVEQPFEGFNRNPYVVSFQAGDFSFCLVNVHLYWSNYGIRRLETTALGRWAKSRLDKPGPPHGDIVLLGDFNMPGLGPGDELYELLSGHGLTVPKYNTELVGSNLAGDKHYDEVAFFPSRTGEDFTDRIGVFDFDKVLFPDLYQENETGFYQYIRYYMADHRPLWVEFRRRAA